MLGPAAGQEAAAGRAVAGDGGHGSPLPGRRVPACPAAGTLPLPDLALARGVGVEGEVFGLGLAPLGEGA